MLNISLPESIKAFVEQQVAKGAYDNANEYILYLICKEQERIELVESLLLAGLDSGTPIETNDEWWESKPISLVQGLESK